MPRPKQDGLPAGIRKRKTAVPPYYLYEINFYAGPTLRQRFERTGTDLREAKRRLAERKREVAEGTYEPGERAKDIATVAEFANRWLDEREGDVLTLKDDRARFRLHILPEMGHLRVSEVAAAHVVALLNTLRTKSSARKRPLSKNTIRNVYANVVTMFADAEQQGFTLRSPCYGVRKAQRPRKAPRAETQGAYFTAEQTSQLISDARIPVDRRMFYALQFFTGTRFGEASGLRWKDYDPAREPLGHLHLHRQYEDRPLKGPRGQPGAARDIPVHPTLAAMLAEWRLRGFVMMVGRQPRPDDFIVPLRTAKCRNLNRGEYAIRADCKRLEFTGTYATHATRRSFITLATAGGAPEAWVKRITHNASGDVLAGYQVNDWPTMCNVVRCIKVERAARAKLVAL